MMAGDGPAMIERAAPSPTRASRRELRATTDELRQFSRHARAPRLRTLREFAEAEIIIPDGEYAGTRFRCQRQPYTGIAFDLMDSGRFQRFFGTGPTQSGKTVLWFAIPAIYHLMEHRETVILGLPTLDMAGDKWREDLAPLIAASRYRDQLPRAGQGSRGGTPTAIVFRNGATLRFMTGGGGDKVRAGFTSRVVVITETDGMDESGGESREADKITQLEARMRAWPGPRRRLYAECTVTVDIGRTWREITAGTNTQIALPCPHCDRYSVPTATPKDRELLRGWQNANDEWEARESAAFHCASCGQAWTEADRAAANLAGVAVHRGQHFHYGELPPPDAPDCLQVAAGAWVVGKAPRTSTLGFRWSPLNNLFLTAADIAADELRAQREGDRDNAERWLCQFVWALPHAPESLDVTPLDTEAVRRRVGSLVKGLVPADTERMAVGADLGKRALHWVVLAFRLGGGVHVVDYGVDEIHSDGLGVERATAVALRELADRCGRGWAREDGGVRLPEECWVDTGWSESRDAAIRICREHGADSLGIGYYKTRTRFRPVRGYASTQKYNRHYTRPTRKGNLVRHLGEEYHVTLLKQERALQVEINADHWKSWVHERLASSLEARGAMTLFYGTPMDHMQFSFHITAEKCVDEFVPNVGRTKVWRAQRRANHYLDALYEACAAGHLLGWRLVDAQRGKVTSLPATEHAAGVRLAMPDGRPFTAATREE